MKEKNPMPFVNDAREGKQGTHRYWISTMKWGELDQMKVLPEDLGDLDEDNMMQRSVSKGRIPYLQSYLTDEPDHFFSALVLVALPRDLTKPAAERQADEEEDDEWDYAFVREGSSRNGKLALSHNVKLFPADGQHRLRAGMAALRTPEGKRLSKEEVPVLIVPFENFDQVRQLFSDLNLNAKAVNRTIGLEFDSRDALVQIAKRVGKEMPLFHNRVNRSSNSLSASSRMVITLNALYEGTSSIANGLAANDGSSVEEFVQTPDAYDRVRSAWDVIIGAFDEWEHVHNDLSPDPNQPNAAGYLRDKFVFPHGLGWQALAMAAGEMIEEYGDDWEDVFTKAVAAIDWGRSSRATWEGVAVIYDDTKKTNRVNNTGPGIRATAKVLTEKAKEMLEAA